MYGEPGGDPHALRPLPGVGYELIRGPDDLSNEGELVLLGNESATVCDTGDLLTAIVLCFWIAH